MPSSTTSRVLTAVRVLLVAVCLGTVALTVNHLATMPPPPPGSDGFAHGMAGLFGGLMIVSSLGLATMVVVLPTLLGWDDPLGFNRWQRLALKAAGVLVGGGFVVALAVGFLAGFLGAAVLWLVLVALAAVVVGATLLWRLGEAAYSIASS